MAIEVLQLCPVFATINEALAQRYTIHRYWEESDPDALLAEHGAKIRGLVTGGHLGAWRGLLEKLPALEVISINGVGYDQIDFEHTRAHNVVVANTPDVLTDDVADLAIALGLALSRKITEGDRFVREGKWLQGQLPLARKFSALRFGIFGLGRIGRAIARRLEGFGVAIAYVDLFEQPVAYPRHAGLVELAEACDMMIVAANATAETAKAVNAAVLAALGPKGMLVNVARGAIVDQEALIAALGSGQLGGAALDVFEAEPEVPEIMHGLPNLVMTPHIASATIETRRAMGELLLANLDAHFAGKPVLTPVA